MYPSPIVTKGHRGGGRASNEGRATGDTGAVAAD
jgi:hypothetical protein